MAALGSGTAFVYSVVATLWPGAVATSAHTGMGALATNSAGAKEDGKKGGKQQKGNNKNRNSADAAGSNPSLNPYMFGATLGK